MELYFHIPFCVRKCAYCDFLSAPHSDEVKEKYINAIKLQTKAEAERLKNNNKKITSIFFGGGTPSVLRAGAIEEILEPVYREGILSEDAEITVECNPGTLDKEKLLSMKKAGVNRISVGLQSVLDEELKLLGRIHTYRDFEESYELIRNAGFTNVNIDLISAIPRQSVKSYEKTLEEVCRKNPEHISAYSLIIEEGTPFYDLYNDDLILREKGKTPNFLPSEEDERKMYLLTKEILLGNGYNRYEISNYAKEGFECRHNKGYWTGEEYLGLGLGASGFEDNIRYKVTTDLSKYLALDFDRYEKELIDEEGLRSEFMMLGLRLTKGVSDYDFKKRFEKSLFEVYNSKIEKLKKQGLIETDGKRVWLTEFGLDVSNVVFCEFI